MYINIHISNLIIRVCIYIYIYLYVYILVFLKCLIYVYIYVCAWPKIKGVWAIIWVEIVIGVEAQSREKYLGRDSWCQNSIVACFIKIVL